LWQNFQNKKNCHNNCGKIFVCEKIATTLSIMKREQTVTSLLGVTQLDAAMLLGVSRSLWSMYELGKRDLPLRATQLLADMLTYIQSQDVATKSANLSNPEAKLQQVERLLRDNEYQQLRIARALATATKKQEALARLSLLADFLKSRALGKEQSSFGSETLIRRATPKPEASFSDTVFELQHQQELLELEKLILESRLRKIRRGTEFTED
jgi:transcriptional regulator with XRE-family HTH domain